MKYLIIREYGDDTFLVTSAANEDLARGEIVATRTAGAATDVFAVKFNEVMALERLEEA